MIARDQEIARTTDHPPPLRLAAFGLGKLDEDESTSIAEHLAKCAICCLLVEAVGDDSLGLLLRETKDRGTIASLDHPENPDTPRIEPPTGYDVLEVLGEGGMGVVSKARQIGLGRLVALKQVRPEILAGWEGVARFRRESEAAARLRHPNIVPIYDVGWSGGVPYYSMEYVEGGTLADRLRQGTLEPKAAACLVEKLARAVQHAHDAGIVHRDLKPGNVLLAPDLDSPKIGDFGLAKQDDDAMRTRSGAILGTPSYMAPEQATGDSAKVGPAADIYALGAILYATLTGRPPFQAPTVLETLELVRTSEPTSLRQLCRTASRDLETIALKCLEKSPDRRYGSARALADDIRRHLDGQPILARAVSSPERLVKWARRRPWEAVSVALATFGLLGALVGTLVHNSRLRAEVLRTEQESKEARSQRARSEELYRSARGTIRQMLERLDEPRFSGKKLDGELGIRRQLIEDALTFYDRAVRDDKPAEISARIDKVRAIREAGNFQILLEKREEADRTMRRALAVLDGLESEGRSDREIDEERIICLSKLAFMLTESGRLDEAKALFNEAIERAEKVFRSHPGELTPGDTVAWGHHNLGCTLLNAGRLSEAEIHLAKATEIRQRLLESHGKGDELQARLAESLINLGFLHMQSDRKEQAEKEFAEAAALLEPYVRDHPDHGTFVLAFGKLSINWGSLALGKNQIDLAHERFRAGRVPVDYILNRSADWPDARRIACKLSIALATTSGLAGRLREAIGEWDRAIALAFDEDRWAYRLGRVAVVVRQGDGSEGLADVEALAGEPGERSDIDLYNLACIAATASTTARTSGASERAEVAALRSLRWLEQALARPIRDPQILQGLAHDPDLDVLRSRRDFQLLRLDATFPADPFLRP